VKLYRRPRPGFLGRSVGTTPRLMAVAAVVGVGAGIGAVVLIKLVELVGDGVSELHDLLGGATAWLLLTVPCGIWLAWWLTNRFGPEAAGHGVPQIIAAIRVRAGNIPGRIAPLKTAATAITIGAGGSAGREGPIAQIGAALGSAIGKRLKLGEPVRRSLIGAGTAAGISATFNAPIAGMLFALEVVLGSFSASHLSTVVVASITGAVVSRSILGEGLTFEVTSYPVSSPWELVLYGLLGIVAAAVAYVFLRQLDWWETRPERISPTLRPLVGALPVAAIGIARPEILGTGQEFIGEVLRDEVTLASGTLLLLVALKAIATSATFGGRGSGGIFMPSLFMGATVGSGLAALIAPHWSLSDLKPGAFALVGMAAVFAAVARAPLTAVLIVFEATGDYGLVLPLMLATLLAMSLAERIHPQSAYTMVLARAGVPLKPLEATDLLDQVTVEEVTSPSQVVLSTSTTLAEAQTILDRHRLHGAPVVENGALAGILAISDIRAWGGPSDGVTAGQAMTKQPLTVSPDMPVSEAMHRMSALGVGRLPVVARDDPTSLVGVFRREDAVRAYHKAVDTASHRQLVHSRHGVRTTSEAAFFEVVVPDGSPITGGSIKETPWPEGCLIVALQRGRRVLVASGDAVIEAGDTLTCFGTPGARARLADRLSAGAGDAAD
jgi:CIC family chloride channel protein